MLFCSLLAYRTKFCTCFFLLSFSSKHFLGILLLKRNTKLTFALKFPTGTPIIVVNETRKALLLLLDSTSKMLSVYLSFKTNLFFTHCFFFIEL